MHALVPVILCAVVQVSGTFHSPRPPVTGDRIVIDLSQNVAGRPGVGLVFTNADGSRDVVGPYSLGRTAAPPDEAARYGISAIRPRAHVLEILAVNRGLAAASLFQKWDTMTASYVSRLSLSCVGE